MMERERKVLVVDDEPVSMKMLSTFLKDASISFDQAMNGREALSKLQEHPNEFCVVLMDRFMPYMSGMEVLSAMQQSNQLRTIPVIILTGLSEKEDIIDAIKAGAFDYLTKPVEKELVVKLVERAKEVFASSLSVMPS